MNAVTTSTALATRTGLGDASTASVAVPPAANITVNAAGASWSAMLLIGIGAFLAGGAVVYFFGPELGLMPAQAREEEEDA